MTAQLPLFDDQIYRLNDLGRSIKYLMNRAAAASPYSREQIVERMNALAVQAAINLTGGNAKSLSLASFNKWLNPAAANHYPSTVALTVFCQAVNSLAPFSPVIKCLGAELMSPEEKRFMEIGQTYLEAKRSRKKMRTLEEGL